MPYYIKRIIKECYVFLGLVLAASMVFSFFFGISLLTEFLSR